MVSRIAAHKQMSSNSFKNKVTYKLQIKYKQYLALNNLHGFICHTTPTNHMLIGAISYDYHYTIDAPYILNI